MSERNGLPYLYTKQRISTQMVYDGPGPFRMLSETIHIALMEAEKNLPDGMMPLFDTFRVEIGRDERVDAYVVSVEVDTKELRRR